MSSEGLGRVLLAAVTSSCLVIIDSSAVGLALPAIQRELGGGLVLQQWVVDGYLLTLGSLLLVAGAVADRFGTARVLTAGTAAFTVMSVACGLAPAGWFLVAARVLQGAAGAVITPSALALITASAAAPVRLRLIARWTAWTAAASVAAPFIGGALVTLGSWRLVFLINLIPAAVLVRPLAGLRRETRVPARPSGRFDLASAALGVVGLGGIVLGLIWQTTLGWGHPLVLGSVIVGAGAVAAYAARQRRASSPQLPLALFRSRVFAAGNVATVWAYGALGLGAFLVGLYLQQRMGLTALAAGIGMLPATLPMLFLSSTVARLATRTGPRLPMTAGPAVAAGGFAWLALAVPPLGYWRDVFGPMVLLGLGLAVMVAPLTSTVLGAVPAGSEGVGSAVNNAAARIASLVAIAASGAIVGGALDDAGFRRGAAATSLLLVAAAATSAVGIPGARIGRPTRRDPTSQGGTSMTADRTRRRDSRRTAGAAAEIPSGPWGTLHAALAFTLEVAALGAYWYIGSRLAPGPGGVAAGLVLAGAFAAAWALFMAPKARRRVPWPWRPLAALAAFAVAGVGAAAFGQPLGLVLVALALVDTVLEFWLRRKY